MQFCAQQSDLVQTIPLRLTAARSSGVWTLAQCYGCDVWTHATNADDQLMLINPEMLVSCVWMSEFRTLLADFRFIIRFIQYKRYPDCIHIFVPQHSGTHFWV